MKITRNYDDIPEQGGFTIIPAGETCMFEISEKEDTYTSKGDVMIKIVLNCIELGPYEGVKIWDNIMLPEPNSPSAKIAGRSKRFLHAINEPFQGNPIEIDTDRWTNKTVLVRVKEGIIVGGKYDGKPKNEVDRYELSEGENTSTTKSPRPKSSQNDLPF